LEPSLSVHPDDLSELSLFDTLSFGLVLTPFAGRGRGWFSDAAAELVGIVGDR
jgi:hypothetical protein